MCDNNAQRRYMRMLCDNDAGQQRNYDDDEARGAWWRWRRPTV